MELRGRACGKRMQTPMRLNGWQRMWVLTALVWLAFLLFLGSGLWPRPTRVYTIEWNGKEYETVGEYAPNESGFQVALEGGEAWPAGEKNADDLAAQRQWRLRWSAIRTVGASWLFPMAFFYALGWGIAWVRRGFRT